MKVWKNIFVCLISGPAGERSQLHASADQHRLGRRWRNGRGEREAERRQHRAPSPSPDDLDQREDVAIQSHALGLLHTRRLQRYAQHQAVSVMSYSTTSFSGPAAPKRIALFFQGPLQCQADAHRCQAQRGHRQQIPRRQARAAQHARTPQKLRGGWKLYPFFIG